jgi:hypothetical protein
MAAIKGRTSNAVAGAAGEAGTLLGRVAVGAMCGVGLVWTVTALWPAARRYVRLFGSQMETLSQSYPSVLLGLLLGITVTLVWQAMRK